MAQAESTNEFYWDTFFVKVEDKLFCVPRHEFKQSSKVFADMFILHSGQDRDHPIVLEGFKKDEFTCLLKVMYPTVKSLTPGGNFELNLKNEEWMSVLKLSTIWNMTKIRQCAIHWLSTNLTSSPIEKIRLAREHRVGAWLNEAVTSLAACNPMPKLEDLTILGWETVARILWIRESLSSNAQNMLFFRRDAIECADCPPSLSSVLTMSGNCRCGPYGGQSKPELTYSGSARPISGTSKILVTLGQIRCSTCREDPYYHYYKSVILCKICRSTISSSSDVRVDTGVTLLEEMFGEEIKGYEKIPEYSPRSPGPGTDNPRPPEI